MDKSKPPMPTSKPDSGSKKLIRLIFPKHWTAQQIADHIKKVQDQHKE